MWRQPCRSRNGRSYIHLNSKSICVLRETEQTVLRNKSSNLDNHICHLPLPYDTTHRSVPEAGGLDLHGHGCNNKHVVKVREQSWFKQTPLTISLNGKTNSGLPRQSPVFRRPINPPCPPRYGDLVCRQPSCFAPVRITTAARGRLTIKRNYGSQEAACTDDLWSRFYRRTVSDYVLS